MRQQEPRSGLSLSALSAASTAATEVVPGPLGRPLSRARLVSVSRRVCVAWRPAARPATQTAPPEGGAVAMLVVLSARRSGSAAHGLWKDPPADQPSGLFSVTYWPPLTLVRS